MGSAKGGQVFRIGARGGAQELAEAAGQVALVTKAGLRGHFGQGSGFFRQQQPGERQAVVQDVLMRRQASGLLEPAREMGRAQVRLRGQAMQAACEATAGTMAAVMNLDEAACAEVCKESGAEVANLNCPGQIVISGGKAAIATACEKAKARGAKRALPLNVAGAYHSQLMASAQAPLANALAGVAMAAPKV